jgi:hypothetical protein
MAEPRRELEGTGAAGGVGARQRQAEAVEVPRAYSCECCLGPLSIGGIAKTGVCQRCLSAGATFARDWMADLRGQGFSATRIAEVVGSTGHAVQSRLSERRRLDALR